jgi:hypothetical protein
MSGRKNVLQLYQLVTNGDMSGEIISSVTNIQFLDNISMTLLFPDASGDGNFYIEVSSDGTNFQALDISPAMLASDADKKIIIEMTQISASMMRLHYIPVYGGGTLNAFIEGKAI